MLTLNDYARSAVPEDKTVNGWHIGLIYIGVGLTLPAFLTGVTVAENLGLWSGILATLIAGIILSGVAIFTGWIGGKTRLSTYFITQIAFGKRGAVLLNLLLTLTVFGWFGVTISMFASALHNILPLPVASELLWSLIGGLLMIGTAIWGFRGLDKLSLVAVPVLLLALIWMSVQSFAQDEVTTKLFNEGSGELGIGVIVSMLVGGWMVGASILPDLSRYARSPGDGSFGGFLCFLPGLLVIMTLSIIPALAFQASDFVGIMLMAMPVSVVALVVALASWSSNDNNLYATSLGLASILPNMPKWIITIVAGAIGTALGVAGIMDHFVGFLVLLGAFIPPVAGAYIMDFILRRDSYALDKSAKQNFRWSTLFAWAVGVLTAFATMPVDAGGWAIIKLTTISALDGLLAAGIVTFILTSICKLGCKKKAIASS